MLLRLFSALADQTHSVPLRSLMKNTLPLLDQKGERFVPFPSVNRCLFVPSLLIVQISCCPAGRPATVLAGSTIVPKAIRFPSGLQAGATIAALLLTATSV